MKKKSETHLTPKRRVWHQRRIVWPVFNITSLIPDPSPILTLVMVVVATVIVVVVSVLPLWLWFKLSDLLLSQFKLLKLSKHVTHNIM